MLPWVLTALPLLLLLLAAWLCAGLALARVALRLRGGVEVSVLALPLGLLAQVMVSNALGYLVFMPAAILATVGLLLGGGLLALRRARPAPLEWELGRIPRLALLLAAVALGLGVWELGSREVFGDDGQHAALAHLLAAGEFPVRLPCNPDFHARYHYGSPLLAAAVMVVAGAPPFESLDPIRALTVTSVLMLAFAAGWRPRRSVTAGLLAVGLLLTVGPMLWLLLPFARGGLATWALHVPGLPPLVDAARQLTEDGWHFAVATPGFITPTYGHAHRALAWGFAPFLALLFLVLLEAPLTRRRKSVALGLVVAGSFLLQAAIVWVLLPGLALWAACSRLARRRGGSCPELDLSPTAVLALGLALGALQGGPLTDALSDRLGTGLVPSLGFHLASLQLPSCRGGPVSLACLLLSVGNLGLTPLLLPWVAYRSWRSRQGARLLLVAGCAVSYAFPFLVRYDYYDWNLQRLLIYPSWTLAVLAAPLLAERMRSSGTARLASLAAVVLMSFQGLVTLGVVLDGSQLRDRADRALFRIGPLDERMMRFGPSLPRGARVLDPAPCLGAACRPALLFGRYASSSRDRLNFSQPSDAYREALADPRPEVLRRLGYTHVYLDSEWLGAMPPDVSAGLSGAAFELLGSVRDGRDARLLLRVCTPQERCALDVSGVF